MPDQPGVYQYYDGEGKILYVGKAKSLRKRVNSYFNRQQDNAKTTVLVRKIRDIQYILVETELDALLLENTLIKKLQPRYNVLLKDDKTYPWICIKKEDMPRVFSTRNLVRDGSEYFGPYGSVKMMHSMLDLVKQLFPLRTCNLLLSPEAVSSKKYKVCLEYHIGNCKGPCEGFQSEADYDQAIAQIRRILKGNIAMAKAEMKQLMLGYAENLMFEKAQVLKDKIEVLDNYQSKSTVVSPSIAHVDVFSYIEDEQTGYVNYLSVIDGCIVQAHTIELKRKLEESREDLFLLGIGELRQRFQSNAKEMIVPFLPEVVWEDATYTVPVRGDKKRLLELSEKNALYYKKEKERQALLVDPDRHSKRIMQQLMKDLRLLEEPRHIECFDNSNFQGSYAVSAMTVFKNGKPSKKDYRHFNIKTVVGPDDFASMEEVIYRRYKKVVEEGLELPQLIVIDGGKGQLASAVSSLEKLGLMGKVGIIGIAKRLEEIFYPGDSIPMYLDKRSESLRILTHIRDEAHRFGITHYRKKHLKGLVQTELTSIKGISKVSAEKLLTTFKSISAIKACSLEELAEVIGPSKANLVVEYFKGK